MTVTIEYAGSLPSYVGRKGVVVGPCPVMSGRFQVELEDVGYGSTMLYRVSPESIRLVAVTA